MYALRRALSTHAWPMLIGTCNRLLFNPIHAWLQAGSLSFTDGPAVTWSGTLGPGNLGLNLPVGGG